MLTLITGTPGAGKTLHAIEKLILPVVGTTIEQRLEDGTLCRWERRIFTNIKGFQVDHDLVESGPAWMPPTREKPEWSQAEGHRQGLHNWHEWAKPGTLIVVDEFQKLWPPRANGAPVPPDVQALDTHRHMGVDFIVITQNANNVDRHVVGLIGRHLHVRRIANFAMAIVYEWDHCSRSLMYSKAISKSPWRFNRRVYKLYHSADLHTKQSRKVPTLLYVVAAALAIGAWKIPESWARLTGKAEEATKASKASGQAVAPGRASAAPHAPAPAASAPFTAPLASAPAPAPVHLGCISFKGRCECFGSQGTRMPVERAICEEASYRVAYVLPLAASSEPPAAAKPATVAASAP